MRVASIWLSWFRGSAAEATLDCQGRSIAVYGANGAGKSCFVDAIEYVLSDGRVQHLAHEYSGRHQERAILNTHRPDGSEGRVSLSFSDGSGVAVAIAPNGSHSSSGDGHSHLKNWDCRRTVLRQDEVSRFVHSTKGEKYSVLLPLLGLHHLEVTAENLRQLGTAVARRSGSQEAAALLRSAKSQIGRVYAKTPMVSAREAITALCQRHVAEPHDHSADACASLAEKAITQRLADASEQQRTQVAVEQLGTLDVRQAIRAVRSASAALAQSADQLLRAQLGVVRAAKAYLAAGSKTVERLTCPACGTEVPLQEMHDHVEAELLRMDAVIQGSDELKRSRGALNALIARARELCNGPEVKRWASSLDNEKAVEIIAAAGKAQGLPDPFGDDQLEEINITVGAAVVAAASAAFLPPPASDLANDKEKLFAARSLLSAEESVAHARHGELLAVEIRRRESAVRERIRVQAQQVIHAISADVQRMWAVLHPGEPIEDVRLQVPEDTDKAIDLALKFYGKDLESPRLTLSEGYRNSLGLCVFLAMAARDAASDAPIVLDDVIVSLDRGHRGMVVDLLSSEFSGRQILLFTHDRDWYGDLRHQLDANEWHFRALLPYQGPEQGIRWSHRTRSFDDAREYLKVRADVAANEARKVLDVELSIQADRLSIELPFARGERNDKRVAHEFLERLVSKGRKAFKKKHPTKDEYEPYSEGIELLAAADRLLVSWANRGSHTEDVVTAEAEKLINKCEAALEALRCGACGKWVSHAGVGTEGSYQCQCGTLKWK